MLPKLVAAYKQVRIGDPRAHGTLCGPLHTSAAVDGFLAGIAEAQQQGCTLVTGGTRVPGVGNFVTPAILESPHDAPSALCLLLLLCVCVDEVFGGALS